MRCDPSDRVLRIIDFGERLTSPPDPSLATISPRNTTMTKRAAAAPGTIVPAFNAEQTATAEPPTPDQLSAVDRYEAGLPVTDEEREAIEALDEDNAKPPRAARKASTTHKRKGKKNSEPQADAPDGA